MPNHFHLLVEVHKNPLSIIMQRMLTGYTRYYNRIHRMRGHLFQGRYKAILCEKDSYLLELVRYIHLNPVRARLVKEPGAWQWCGHKELAENKADKLISDDYVLKYFSEDKSRARGAYRTFIRDGLNMGHQRDMYPEEKTPYLGREEYIKEHQAKHEQVFASAASGMKKDASTMLEVLKSVSEFQGVASEVICGNSRKQHAVIARREFVSAAYSSGHKPADIARFIGKSHTFVSRVIDKIIV